MAFRLAHIILNEILKINIKYLNMDADKSKDELIRELDIARQQIRELESAREESDRVKKALVASEEKLNTLFSSMTEMVVLHELMVDEKGRPFNYRITDCNSAFTKITGIKKEFAIGRLATEVYQQETAPYLEEFSSVALKGEPFEYTTYYAPMDKHFLISVVSPKKGYFATITTDVTEIKEIENVLKAKNKELENYLYVASHDLRAPLINIQGFSQLLSSQADNIKKIVADLQIDNNIKNEANQIADSNIPKTLNYIFTSVEKMDKLIKGLLQISRTGRMTMTISEIDMNYLIRQVIDSQKFQIEEAGAVVKVATLNNCYGDLHLLNQLFSNLISNALKYKDKERRLKIEISSQTKYRQVTYTIKDNGIGIAQKHLEKIWDVFFRIRSEPLDSNDGIGLSIVKRISDKHKGVAKVKSELGKGTVFQITLQGKPFTE